MKDINSKEVEALFPIGDSESEIEKREKLWKKFDFSGNN